MTRPDATLDGRLRDAVPNMTRPGDPPSALAAEPVHARMAASVQLEVKARPGVTLCEARYCDETPFRGTRYAWSEGERRYAMRVFEARLQVRPSKMSARIDTPAGVPILWSHSSWSQAVGRVRTMAFSGGELLGEIAIRDEDLRYWVAGGVDCLADGINRGLSLGLQYLETPAMKWEIREGTQAKPDLMTYGAVRIVEVSLTPMPRIHTAGILGILSDAPGENADSSSEDD